MTPLEPLTLRGRHVTLEPLRMSHVAELWQAAQDPDTWRYMGHVVTSEQELGGWVRARLDAVDADTAWAFLQRDAVTGKALGSTSLFDVEVKNRKGEIGHTWIDAAHRSGPSNPEAKLLLFTFAFEVQRFVRVQLKTDSRNARSRAAILKLGATFEGILRNHWILPDGYVRDSAFHSVLDREWPAVKTRLEERLAAQAAARPPNP